MANKVNTLEAFDLLHSLMQPMVEKHANEEQRSEQGYSEDAAASTGHFKNPEHAEKATMNNVEKAKKNEGKQGAGKLNTVGEHVNPTVEHNKPKDATEEFGDAQSKAADKEASARNVARVNRLGHALANTLEKAAQDLTQPVHTEMTIGDMIVKEACEKANEYAYWYAKGKATRLQDTWELKEAQIDERLLAKVGGINGLLDKHAEEALPAELAGPDESAAAEAAEGARHAEPDADNGTHDGGGDEEALKQISEVLAQSGVSEEEVVQLLQQIEAAHQSGVSEEEILQALTQLAQEAAPAAQAAPGAGLEKLSSEDRVALCKQFFAQQ